MYFNIVDILKEVLGEHKHTGIQIDFNCPRCAYLYNNGADDNRYNLSINLRKLKYKCWKCGLKGSQIQLLIDRYSKNKINWNLHGYLLNHGVILSTYKKAKLPKEFISFQNIDFNNENHVKAYQYLEKRNIDTKIINKYNLGFCVDGYYKNRIIIPSYDSDGILNYFTGRTFLDDKNEARYLNEKDVSKDVIFFENLIDFNTRIYIVEGSFDAFPIPNSTPIMGKEMQEALFIKILQHKTPTSMILDADAIKKSDNYRIKLQNCDIPVSLHKIEDKDPSKIYQEHGKKGIYELLTNYI